MTGAGALETGARPDVLVTGASGFVGAALVARLRLEGWRVIATDLRARAEAGGGVAALDVTDDCGCGIRHGLLG